MAKGSSESSTDICEELLSPFSSFGTPFKILSLEGLQGVANNFFRTLKIWLILVCESSSGFLFFPFELPVNENRTHNLHMTNDYLIFIKHDRENFVASCPKAA